MQKKITNFTVVSIVNTINNADGFWMNPDKRSKLKVSMPVRSVLKYNFGVFEKLGKDYMESYNEIISELQDSFVQDSKAERDGDGNFKIKDGCQAEYENLFGQHISKLLQESHDVELRSYTSEALERYAELNGELLTEAEMDILEVFIEEMHDAQ